MWFSRHVFPELCCCSSLVAGITLTVMCPQVLSPSPKAALGKREVEDSAQLSRGRSAASPEGMSNNKLLFSRCLLPWFDSFGIVGTRVRGAGWQPRG